MKVREVLWSGGFDSTALVLQALHAGDAVRPIVLEAGEVEWQKLRRERRARERIRETMPAEFRARLWPDRFIRQEPIFSRIDALHLDADRRLQTIAACGCRPVLRADVAEYPDGFPWVSRQNALLLAFAELWPGVEAGFVESDQTFRCPVYGDRIRAAFRLPLADWSKAELLAWAESAGLRRLLDLTWTCEADNADAAAGPCGACDPCRARIIPATID